MDINVNFFNHINCRIFLRSAGKKRIAFGIAIANYSGKMGISEKFDIYTAQLMKIFNFHLTNLCISLKKN